MKGVQSVMFRALSFLLVGLLMVSFPDKVTTWLVMVVGVLFLIPGLVSIATFFKAYTRKDATRMLLPVIGVGSVVLGCLLLLMPEDFGRWLMYVLAGVLILVGVMGIVNLIHFRKFVSIGTGYYLIPVLVCGAGLFVMLHPLEVAANSIMVLGVANIIYGLTELVYAIRFRKVYRQIAGEGNGENCPEKAEATLDNVGDAVPVEEDTPVNETPDESVSEVSPVTPEEKGYIDFSEDNQIKEE